MEKNIIVLNELGQQVSLTYPKRAKGLVKSGRAEYVNDCAIRLLITHDPTVFDNDNMEDFTMSKVICFNTREFNFDKTCQGNNVGTRMFITDAFGKNVEVFEIGDGSSSWTQIACEKVLEKETDYVFRFAMNRSGDYGVSRFIVMPIREDLSDDENWENRYTFNLANGEYKPSLNKVVGGKNLKIFEIPFNTHDIEKYRFVFVEQFSVARIFTPAEKDSYESFPDADRSFFEETKNQFENMLPKDFNMGQTFAGAAESVKKAFDNIDKESIKKAFDKVSSTVVKTAKSFTEDHFGKGSYHGANLEASSLQSILAEMNEDDSLKFYGCNISDDSDCMDCGNQTSDVRIVAIGCNLGGQAFAGFTQKIGDDSVLECSGSNIGSYFGNVVSHGGPVSDVKISLSGCKISESSFARLLSVIESGKIDMNGAFVDEEEGDFWYGNTADGLVIDAKEANLPEKVLNKINAKFGDGCLLNR